MPKQILPSREEFLEFEKELLRRNFRRINPVTLRKSLAGKIAPRKRFGREIGFEYEKNGLKVVVWTTILEGSEVSRESDAGWVLILSGEKIVYSSRPKHRTRNFLKTLLFEAQIARKRLIERPVCAECLSFMNVTRGQGMKSRYWSCKRKKNHMSREVVAEDWDHGLPEEALRYLKSKRKEREKERRGREKEGKEIFVALRKRKRWIEGRGK